MNVTTLNPQHGSILSEQHHNPQIFTSLDKPNVGNLIIQTIGQPKVKNL